MDETALKPVPEQKYAFVFLDCFSVLFFDSVGGVWKAIDTAVKQQRPYMTFERKARPGHKDLVWHPRETRYFDPKPHRRDENYGLRLPHGV